MTVPRGPRHFGCYCSIDSALRQVFCAAFQSGAYGNQSHAYGDSERPLVILPFVPPGEESPVPLFCAVFQSGAYGNQSHAVESLERPAAILLLAPRFSQEVPEARPTRLKAWSARRLFPFLRRVSLWCLRKPVPRGWSPKRPREAARPKGGKKKHPWTIPRLCAMMTSERILSTLMTQQSSEGYNARY